jgi:signal transduction histidine kinase
VARREAITRAVLDATPDAIGLFDNDGRPLLANEPMREMAALLDVREHVASNGDGADEIVEPRTGRTLDRYAASLGEGQHLLVLRDVTAEREADRLKDEFFALVSHELRTPLTSVIGYLELLRSDGIEDPQNRQFLDVIDRNARRLLRLVGDLLFIAQVEAGKLSLERSEVDLAAVASESVEAARPRADAAGVALATDVAELPAILGDRDRIGQAVDNLVSNALKFTLRGGSVTVRLRRDDGHALVEVADTGMGISRADQERLFERFFRTDAATSAAIPGVGLGLTITRAIVEGHGGSVSVHSVEGEGTTFAMRLPLAVREEVAR